MTMKILEINSCNFGSTGKIMLGIADAAKALGYQVICCWPCASSNKINGTDKYWEIGSRISRNIHLKLSYYSGMNGCFSTFSTLRLIRKIKKYNPDIVHLHNLHNCYINLPILFHYLKSSNVKTVWTLHDCWAFTGGCAHFTLSKCSKWKTGCFECSHYKEYPETFVDRTQKMWNLKRKWFNNVPGLTIVTPSRWLAEIVRESFLSSYEPQIVYNGIDLNIFKPTVSDFKERYGISSDKKIVLGVSFTWGYKKGLDVFIELAKRLNRDYQIVLVGTDANIDKQLPVNVISIHKTNSQMELAEIYSAADILVNPTREEVLGLINIEANACGTPVITFNSGGSPECINEKSGFVIEVDDFETLLSKIELGCSDGFFESQDCVNQAAKFSKEMKYKQYLEIYNHYGWKEGD